MPTGTPFDVTGFNQAAISFPPTGLKRSGIIKTRHLQARAQAGATQSAKAGVEIARGRVIWRVNLRRESGEVRTELPEPHTQVSEAVPKGTEWKLEGDDSALRRGVFTLRNRAETQGTKRNPGTSRP